MFEAFLKKDDPTVCTVCNGHGKRRVWVVCPTCKGTGDGDIGWDDACIDCGKDTGWHEMHVCDGCDGKGTTRGPRK